MTEENKKQSPLKHWLVLSLIFTAVITVFLLSELLYMIRNNSPQLNYLLLNRARYYAEISDSKKSFKYLDLIVRLNSSHNSSIYKKNQIALNYKLDLNSLLNTNSQFLEKYRIFLIDQKSNDIPGNKDMKISKIFYETGLFAYSNGQQNLTPVFFRAAISIEPELSFYHVELANYFLLQNDIQSAKEAINFCLRFKYPQRHCQDYLNSSLRNETLEDVGFLREALGKYYGSP